MIAILLGLVAVIVFLMLRLSWYEEKLDLERRRARREHSMRVATEVVLCEMIEEQVGSYMRANERRVSETTARFAKASRDGRPN